MANDQCEGSSTSHWTLGFGHWSLFSSRCPRVSRRYRIVLKGLVWVLCLTPLAVLAHRAYLGDLTANPISFITNTLGQWTFRLLLASLALTPIRLVFGISWPV